MHRPTCCPPRCCTHALTCLLHIRCCRHPELIKRDWVKPGAVVIDVGINVVSSSSLDSVSSFAGEGYHVVGDVAYPDVSTVAGAITPVPGGVGPMTIAAVLHNTLLAAKYRAGLVAW